MCLHHNSVCMQVCAHVHAWFKFEVLACILACVCIINLCVHICQCVCMCVHMCMPVHMHVCVCAVRDSIQETVDDIREEDAAATLCMIFYFSCLNDSEWVHSTDQQSLFLAICCKIWRIILLINTVPLTFILLHLHDYKWWCTLKQCAYIFCLCACASIHTCVCACLFQDILCFVHFVCTDRISGKTSFKVHFSQTTGIQISSIPLGCKQVWIHFYSIKSSLVFVAKIFNGWEWLNGQSNDESNCEWSWLKTFWQ